MFQFNHCSIRSAENGISLLSFYRFQFNHCSIRRLVSMRLQLADFFVSIQSLFDQEQGIIDFDASLFVFQFNHCSIRRLSTRFYHAQKIIVSIQSLFDQESQMAMYCEMDVRFNSIIVRLGASPLCFCCMSDCLFQFNHCSIRSTFVIFMLCIYFWFQFNHCSIRRIFFSCCFCVYCCFNSIIVRLGESRK